MYENVTFESILQSMLDRIPEDMDKREGSIIYDALAPAAVEMQNMYIELDNTLNETFADTASREYLIKRCAEAGITPKPATKAVIMVSFEPYEINVPIGTKFSINDINYIMKEVIQGVPYLECETPGVVGNIFSGTLIPIDYIDGLEFASIVALVLTGAEEEETEALRKRYFDRLNNKPFGGNVADYKEAVNAIPGVGGVKVWHGHYSIESPGRVIVQIMASNYKAPMDDTVRKVQKILTGVDYYNGMGDGKGLAPIGHWVDVRGVGEVLIEVDTDITYQSEYSWEDVEEEYNAALDNYYIEIAKTWQEGEELIVRIHEIEKRLLDVNGIRDITVQSINGVNSNYSTSSIAGGGLPVRVLTDTGGGGIG